MQLHQRAHKQSQVICARMRALFLRGKEAAQSDPLLRQAFDELAIAVELLEQAEARADAHHDAQLDGHPTLEQTYQHYYDLFEHAPAGYLVTSLEGTIHEANEAAAGLLGVKQRQLIGCALAFFLPPGQRRALHYSLALLRNATDVQMWQQDIQPVEGPPITVIMRVAVARGRAGQLQVLRWLLYEVPVFLQPVLAVNARRQIDHLHFGQVEVILRTQHNHS